MESLNEHLSALVAGGVASLVLWLRAWALDLWRRRILESALGRAAGLALADPAVRAGAQAALDLAVAHAAAYLERSIPDTLRRLGVGGALPEMVRGEIGRRLAQPPAAPPAPEPVRIPRTPVLFEGDS